MTRHEFIFSDQRKHRIARHVAFWTLWCIAYNLLFHFPIHVFKGWDVSGPGTKNYQELGPALFFIKSLIVNSFLAVIAPQILLTYVLLYWLLPNYFFISKNYFVSTVATLCVLLIFNFVAVGFKYSNDLYNLIAGTQTGGFLPFSSTQWVVTIDQLGSLPIILGFALMIRFVKRWWLKQKQTAQLAEQKANAELQLLKAQVHPHFLFNTLNNIYFFMLSGSSRAAEMINKLSGLLHYILNECNQPLVPLQKEIKMISDYMALEKIRYSDNMLMTVDIRNNGTDKMITPLLLLPFVENSFKHGASKLITQPWVRLTMDVEDNWLHFTIKNNKTAINNSAKGNGNIGLKNVKKRLELLYGKKHELDIVCEAESYTVNLRLQLHDLDQYSESKNETKPLTKHAMA